MKNLIKTTLLFGLFLSIFLPEFCQAQIPGLSPNSRIRQEVREEVRENLKEKYGEKGKEEARKALDNVTYENDTRYPVPENKVKATIVIQTKTFKNNGKVKDANTMKLIFGPTGEVMIMNESEKNESRMLFDYEGAATYMINVKNKTAMKMPMINFKKIAKKMAENSPGFEESSGTWQKTSQRKSINGHNCQKYMYTDEEGSKMLMWFTQDISIDLSGNHLFGGQITDFSTGKTASPAQNDNFPSGLMIRSTMYEKGDDKPSMQMDITEFSKTYDPDYFDLSEYTVNDLLGRI